MLSRPRLIGQSDRHSPPTETWFLACVRLCIIGASAGGPGLVLPGTKRLHQAHCPCVQSLLTGKLAEHELQYVITAAAHSSAAQEDHLLAAALTPLHHITYLQGSGVLIDLHSVKPILSKKERNQFLPQDLL